MLTFSAAEEIPMDMVFSDLLTCDWTLSKLTKPALTLMTTGTYFIG
jgi:hypothetical protein